MSDPLSSDLASLRIQRDDPHVRSGARGVTRWLLLAGLLLLGVAVAVAGYQRLEGAIFRQEVKTGEVFLLSPSQTETLVTATGYVVPQRTSKVGAKLPGRLARVFIKEGDTVREGNELAQLEDADQRSQMASALSRVAVAQARVATARANLAEVSQQVERTKALVRTGSEGRAALDNVAARETALREAVKAAQTEVAASQAERATYDVGLADRRILAPISGRIVAKPATVGEFVGGVGNIGLVAEIVDFESLMVETDVPEARLHLVKLGGPCEIVLDAYPNRRWRGVAAELGQRVNRQKASVVVKVKFADALDAVLPEMSARVSFLSKGISDDALKQVPKKVVAKESIVERDGHAVMFVVESGKLSAYPVTVGPPLGDENVELTEGPPSGTKIVSKPTGETKAGQRIKESDK